MLKVGDGEVSVGDWEKPGDLTRRAEEVSTLEPVSLPSRAAASDERKRFLVGLAGDRGAAAGTGEGDTADGYVNVDASTSGNADDGRGGGGGELTARCSSLLS